MSDPNLVTTCNLHGQDYLIKMNVVRNYLELTVTDKQSGAEWQCSYDRSFIENLTHKTGNFKQFDIFVTMLKSGLLKTSSCIGLDLLTYDDLEALRITKLRTTQTRTVNSCLSNNKRYLILTYTVEFDRIHYPLPLEYCGPPDPSILQATIKKLENDLQDAREAVTMCTTKKDLKEIYELQKRIEDLEYENDALTCENYELKKQRAKSNKSNSNNNNNNSRMMDMQRAINKLEKSVIAERKSHNRIMEKLRNEKVQLHKEVERMKNNEKMLKARVQELIDKQVESGETFKTMYRRKRSPLTKADGDIRYDNRYRPISLRETRSDGWASDDKSYYYEKSLHGTRTRTRSPVASSLMSSARERMTAIKQNYVVNTRMNSPPPLVYPVSVSNANKPVAPSAVAAPATTTRTTRKRLKKVTKNKLSPRSRSTSTGSNYSNSSTPKSKQSDRLHDMVRSSEAEFKSLEERMQWLQKLLQAQ